MLNEQKLQLPNSIQLNVQYEKGHDTTVLFLHFSGGTLHMWNGVLPLFEKEYNVLVPDMRGHGKSGKPTTGYHIEEMAHDLFLLLQELEITKCHIVGSSMGAEVGLCLAAAHPEIVQSLVCEGALYNEFGPYGLFNGTEKEIEAEKEKIRQQLEERVVPLHKSKADYLAELIANFQQSGFWNEYFATYIDSCIVETEEGLFTHHYQNHVRIEYIQKYWELKFEEYYQKITCPVLFLPSEEEWKNDRIQHSFNYFSSFLPKFEVAHIKDAVHAYVWMQQPKLAGEIIKEFIKKHE